MSFTINNFNSGYSQENYLNSPLSKQNPILLIGRGLNKVPKFDENRRPIPNTVDKTQIEVYYPGFGTMNIKFSPDFTLPKIADLTEIELLEAQAFINVKGRIYVKAEGVKAVGK
ncbi:hypothetical protein [Fructobacillus fructosus]|uniref:hypothetical protein n=1 Tax=Fructobacillus fructosus TaxID=1631 RepID=UPI00200A53F5|nr:hypothetical protein [Fructobacillus fructosus]MCK8638992.1 hypothetical protein [Fructobacillus fructosus]